MHTKWYANKNQEDNIENTFTKCIQYTHTEQRFLVGLESWNGYTGWVTLKSRTWPNPAQVTKPLSLYLLRLRFCEKLACKFNTSSQLVIVIVFLKNQVSLSRYVRVCVQTNIYTSVEWNCFLIASTNCLWECLSEVFDDFFGSF